MDHSNYEKTAIEAAHLGGKVLKKYFNNLTDFKIKSEASIVTTADTESENVISDFLIKKTPDFSILAEESGLSERGKNRWIIDPLDGTTNFFHGFPNFSISIALELDGKIIAGVIHNPITEEMYHCSKGSGAFRNNKSIHVSKTKELINSMLGTGFSYQRGRSLDGSLELFRRFTELTHGIRRPGSAALDFCYVACGMYDGFYEKDLNPWDVAAGYLLVEEAGGKVTSFKGEKFSIYENNFVASNGLIHDQMVKVINS
ncbi:MAG: inositol monophosphatase family protein [Proteobacteria bacterium]|nr:inositol monophosphatase family protein [Pseudomonadota bacterium]